MAEEYQQAVSLANLGGIRDLQSSYTQLGLKNSPQVSIRLLNLESSFLFLIQKCF